MKTISFDELLTRVKLNRQESSVAAFKTIKEMLVETEAAEAEISLGWLKDDEEAEDFEPRFVLRVVERG